MKDFLSPVYQPIVSLQAGAISHYEVLTRTVKRDLRLVSDHAKLIEYGERCGLVEDLDISMLKCAIKKLKSGCAMKLAVNISVATIESSSDDYLVVLFESKNIASMLIFEISETVFISDMDCILRFVSIVRSVGARVAVDDFGDGYFTLSQVEIIRPNFLKLSQHIINDLERPHELIPELQGVIRNFGGALIAEGIDSEYKFKKARKCNVQYAQGSYIGEPQPFIF